MNLKSHKDDELRERLLEYLDDGLDQDEKSHVEELLLGDTGAREILRELALHAVVIADGERAAAQTQTELRRVENYQGVDDGGVPQRQPDNRVMLPWALAATSICICLALVWHSALTEQVVSDPSISANADDLLLAEIRFAANAHFVASALSDETPMRSFGEGMRLARGSYVLISGFAELDFFNGVVVAVESPAELELISQREARLLSGRVTVEAGDAQNSFLLHTPVGEVLDIGTRYGVYVREDGVTETHVFEGLVDIQPTESRKTARRIRAESAIKLTTSGVAETLPVSESAFPRPTRQIANLLLNPDFEAGTELHVGEAEVGCWGGDICRIVGERYGIHPFSGERMLLFQSTGRGSDGRASSTAASQLSQWIDVTPFRSAIAEGRVRVKFRARFNRVAGDEKTDSQFTINLESFGVAPDEARRLLKSNPQMPRSRASCSLLSDSKPESWEDIETSLTLPKGTKCLQAEVLAFENILNDQDEVSEFDGHFADHLQFELIVEPASSEDSMNHL